MSLPGLKKLSFGESLTDAGLIQLQNMQSLQELRLYGSQITSKGISVLTQLPSLHTLDLAQATLPSEDDWITLGKLSALQSLRLRRVRSEVTDALTDLCGVLRPGGLLVIQNRNFDRVWAERERFMPPQSYQDAEGEWLFLRFYDFGQETVSFNMLRLRRTEDGWGQDVESTELRPIFGDELARALAAAGFDQVTLYGSYDGSPFEPVESDDLIAVARRSG